MDRDQLKAMSAQAALAYARDGEPLGVGTGSTVDLLIDALAAAGRRPSVCVASSERSAARLRRHGFPLATLAELREPLAVYIDGADEIDHDFAMIKGGGGALTREKILAAAAATYVCVADESKLVDTLGRFPLPVEVIPLALPLVAERLRALGGEPVERDFVTDNGCRILDVSGLRITDPRRLEAEINQWPGVVTVGLFAARGADILLLGTPDGVRVSRRG